MRLACIELSKNQFDQVHKNLIEFDADEVPNWWMKFKANWKKSYKAWSEKAVDAHDEDELSVEKIKEQLDFCLEEDALRVFDFAGCGSQRAAFVDGNGMCLKVGFTQSAEKQFEREEKVLKKLGARDCFPKIFDFGENCMLCESVETSTDFIWKQMFGVTCDTAVNCLRKMAIREKIEEFDIAKFNGDKMEDAKKFVANVLFGKEQKWKVMKQMHDAIAEDVDIAFDIDHADNWGIVERNGSKAMVCIDVGL